MSIHKKTRASCPKCGQEFEVSYWQSLNAQLNPEERDKLLAGKLFWATCPECGEQSRLDYPVIYHDMAHKVMVHYTQPDAVTQVIANVESLDKDVWGENGHQYRHRVVETQNSLIEKATIFALDLDDRIVEYMKLIYQTEFRRSFPDKELFGCYFAIDAEGGYALQFVLSDGQMMVASLSRDDYDSFGGQLRDTIAEMPAPQYIVDAEWALELLEMDWKNRGSREEK